MDDEEEQAHRRTIIGPFARAGHRGYDGRRKHGISSASTAGDATRCSTRRCSSRSRRRAPCCLHGRTITTTFSYAVRPAILCQANLSISVLADHRGEALRHTGAPRPAPLRHRTHHGRTKLGTQTSIRYGAPTRLPRTSENTSINLKRRHQA